MERLHTNLNYFALYKTVRSYKLGFSTTVPARESERFFIAVAFLCSQTKSFSLKTLKFLMEEPETHRDTEKKTAGL